MNMHKVWDTHIISEPKIELITNQINLINYSEPKIELITNQINLVNIINSINIINLLNYV